MNEAPIYIVDVIGEVATAADAVLYPTLNKHILYTYGRSIQILKKLQSLNDAIAQTTKDGKYPLLALFQDFPEDIGTSGYYCTVRLPKISIATLTQCTDDPVKRYATTFKPILYPIYLEILNQLARHPNIIGNDPRAFVHRKWDRPGTQPEGQNLNDYVDAIEIEGLQLTFKQVIKCKPS